MKGRLMIPLFWRIFILIWLAMAAAMLLSGLASALLLDRERAAIERQLELRGLGFEVTAIRQDRGRSAAHRFLKTQGHELGLHLIMIDAEDDSRLPAAIRTRLNSGWYRQKPTIIELSDGYRLVAWPKMHGQGWLEPRVFRLVEMALTFVLITLACWLIARFVSRPVRYMEATAEAIAAGNKELRVNERIAARRDEIGHLATAFNTMTDQLCTLLDRQKQLLRDISHDLRTPLARQRIAIELASDDGADADLMASILRQNERLEAMTAQILTLYRVRGQGGDIAREPLRPVEVLNQVLQDGASDARHRGVDCRLHSAPETTGVSVLGDAGLLHRAMENVVLNALDHTPPGKAVRISLTLSSDWLNLTVADEGPGVEEDSLEHLFEPFFQADESRGSSGWGLGLAIAKDIVLAHDGRITASNREQGGLELVVQLPVFAVN